MFTRRDWVLYPHRILLLLLLLLSLLPPPTRVETTSRDLVITCYTTGTAPLILGLWASHTSQRQKRKPARCLHPRRDLVQAIKGMTVQPVLLRLGSLLKHPLVGLHTEHATSPDKESVTIRLRTMELLPTAMTLLMLLVVRNPPLHLHQMGDQTNQDSPKWHPPSYLPTSPCLLLQPPWKLCETCTIPLPFTAPSIATGPRTTTRHQA